MTGRRGRARLRRADRVRNPKDFRRLSREGSRRTGRHFVALVGPGRDSARSRLGLTVSRRVANAVGRNRVKRQIREWFRHSGERIPKGQDVVIIARRGAAELESAAVQRELRGLFQ